MTGTHLSTDTPRRLLRSLFACFSMEWIVALVELTHSVTHLLALDRHGGMYEILDYNSTLDPVDRKGTIAVFKRHQRVKYLQNNILTFQDHAWGEGEIFADYQVSPGSVVDRYQEGDRWNILISLRETKSRGDVESFHIERTVRNGFASDEEWWQVEIWQKTHQIKLQTLFPKERHCRRAVLQTRAGNKTTVLGHEHFQLLPDGRQMLTWQAKHPRQAEVYTIRWTW